MRLITICCVVLAACGEPPVAPQQDPAPAPIAEPAPPVESPPPPSSAPVRIARVVEVLDAAPRYTFARMDACGQEAWVAGPKAEMEVGQFVEMKGGQGMADFKSEALSRTFDQLLMVDAWRLSETEPTCGTTPPPQEGGEPLRFGTIREVLSTESYTILRLDDCGEEVWVAGPYRAGFEVGGLAGMPIGSPNPGFFAASMQKRFDMIYFVQWIKSAKALPACPP